MQTPPPLPPPLAQRPRRKKSRTIFWIVVGVLTLGAVELAIIGYAFSKPRRGPNLSPPQKRHQASPERRSSRQNFGQGLDAQPQQAQPARPRPKPTGPPAAKPEFSVKGGVFTNNFTLTLSARSTNATIRYSVNGAEPDETSTAYANPIPISGSTLIRAACFEDGFSPSLTVTHTYTMLDAGLADFTSNLPLVIIEAFGQRIQKEEWAPVSARFIPPSGARASLLGKPDWAGRGEIKRRGFTSLRLPKASFTFKLREDGEKTQAAVFGLPEESDWVLYAPYADKTLMRDALAYELSNQMGRYAPRTRYCEVFLSRYGGKITRRDYVGVYVFEEKIKRDQNRVNVAKLTPGDNTEPNISGGYIFKRDHWGEPGGGFWGGRRGQASADGEYGFSTRRGLQLFYVDPKESELTPPQKAWLANYMNQFERALYGSNFKSPAEGYAKYLDVDSFIDHHWIVEMSKNIDGLRYSCYMFKDRNGKIKMEPLWDWNLSFGNADYYDGWDPTDWYYPLLRETEVCWFRRLAQDPDFHQRHIDRWAELRRDIFAPAKVLRRVDEMAAELNEAQARNFQQWRILGRNVEPNYYVGRTYEEELDWMKNWIRRRITWIDSQFPALPAFAVNPSTKQAGNRLVLTGPGKIYYTTDGSDPRARGGGVAKGAREYHDPIALDREMSILARAQQGDAWSAPATGKFDPATRAAR